MPNPSQLPRNPPLLSQLWSRNSSVLEWLPALETWSHSRLTRPKSACRVLAGSTRPGDVESCKASPPAATCQVHLLLNRAPVSQAQMKNSKDRRTIGELIQGEASIGVAAAAVASSRSKKGRSAQSLAKEAAKGPKYRGMVGTLLVIKREEGVRSLYSGLSAGLQRQMAFGAIRIGLYDSVKQGYINLFQANGLVSQHNVGLRILAGVTTGGAAVLFAQPTDVVKVRLQAQGTKGPRRYTGCINAYRTIGAEEGMRGLWRGALPNITRNAIVNATELVSYDLIKEAIVRHHLLSDNMPCHFVSAFGAGFCTTVIASPVDVVKTRFMNSSSGVYKGAFDCARTMFREGGVQAFYKGFMPSFMRLGSWNIVMFVSYEQIKRGVAYLSQRSNAPVVLEEATINRAVESVSSSPSTPSSSSSSNTNRYM